MNRIAPALVPAGIVAVLLLAAPAPAEVLPGSYEGLWQNTTFGSSGPASILIEFDDPNFAVTIDLDGFVFGFADPDPFVVTGTIDPNGQAAGVLVDPFFGSIELDVDEFDMLTVNLPDIVGTASINSASLSGPVGDGVIDLDYTVVFADGSEALGTLDADLVPEPASMAALALASLALLYRRRP